MSVRVNSYIMSYTVPHSYRLMGAVMYDEGRFIELGRSDLFIAKPLAAPSNAKLWSEDCGWLWPDKQFLHSAPSRNRNFICSSYKTFYIIICWGDLVPEVVRNGPGMDHWMVPEAQDTSGTRSWKHICLKAHHETSTCLTTVFLFSHEAKDTLPSTSCLGHLVW